MIRNDVIKKLDAYISNNGKRADEILKLGCDEAACYNKIKNYILAASEELDLKATEEEILDVTYYNFLYFYRLYHRWTSPV